MSAFWAAVKAAPVINAVFDKAGSLANFNKTTSRNMGVFSGILTLFAVAMAVGIIYNSARISLSERAWELASLRVLGMTRAEVSVLLLAELGAELLLALPIGAAAGFGLATADDAIDVVGQHRFCGGDRAVHLRLGGADRAGRRHCQRAAGAPADRPS